MFDRRTAHLVRVVASILFIALVVNASSSTGDPAAALSNSEKGAPPAADVLRDAIKRVRGAYSQKIDAASAPDAKVAVATEMITAAASENDPVDRFAMLALARDTAASAGAVETASDAIDALDRSYRIDAMRVKTEAATIAAKAPNSNAGRMKFAKTVLRLLGRAVADDRYELVHELSNLALNAARAANNPSLVQKATDESHRASAMLAAYNESKSSITTLANDPDNPEANFKVGRFQCFVKNNWQAGLPLLAKGSDSALKELAGAELAGPTDADVQLKIADRWWTQAGREKSEGKLRCQEHAAKWYTMALPGVSGLKLFGIKKRLAEVQASEDAAPGIWRELIKTMSGSGARVEGGVIVMTEPTRLESQEIFTPPVTFRVIVATDGYDIRIKYACEQLIFNWHGNPDELRIDGGAADGRHKMGVGRVPAKQYVTIELEVLPNSFSVAVNGERRHHVDADFSNVAMPFTIFPAEHSTLHLKSILVREP